MSNNPLDVTIPEPAAIPEAEIVDDNDVIEGEIEGETVIDARVVTVENTQHPVEQDRGGIVPPLNDHERTALEQTARDFVRGLSDVQYNSPEFMDKIGFVFSMGDKAADAATTQTNRMLDRASTSLKGAKTTGHDGSIMVASSLNDLRSEVERMNPHNKQKGWRGIVQSLPFGKFLNEKIQEGDSAADHLSSIIDSLKEGREALNADNEDLSAEAETQYENLLQLRNFAYLSKVLEEEYKTLRKEQLSEQNQGVDSTEIALMSESEHNDFMFAIKQKQSDLTQQAVVGTQGYMTSRLIIRNNIELIKGVERAERNVLPALRTAIIGSTALAKQEQVYNQVEAVSDAASTIIRQTGAMLKDNTVKIHKQAASSGLRAADLESAIRDTQATIDQIDKFKATAIVQLEDSTAKMRKALDGVDVHVERFNKPMLGE